MKDIAASRAFYEKLGFSVFGGDQDQNWLILQNGAATIGLFQGMFERNTLTFNPGWDTAANTLAEFTDVRELQRRQEAGIEPALEADESGQSGQLHGRRPGRQPDPLRPARLTGYQPTWHATPKARTARLEFVRASRSRG